MNWQPADKKPPFAGVFRTKLLDQDGGVIDDDFAFFNGEEWGNNQHLEVALLDEADFASGRFFRGSQNKTWAFIPQAGIILPGEKKAPWVRDMENNLPDGCLVWVKDIINGNFFLEAHDMNGGWYVHLSNVQLLGA